MEKLNSDEKISVLMKLSSREIIQVCNVNKNLARICKDTRYDSLWIKKIREDFNVEYNAINAYEEYKRLFLLYNTKHYILKVYEAYLELHFMFFKIEDVIKYIRKNIEIDAETDDDDLITREKLETGFEDQEFTNEALNYSVIETNFMNPNSF